MAIILPDLYPGRANPVSIDYPQGSFKDRSAPGAMDGTPLKADWANDKEGFFQSLLKDAEITPNGDVDTAENSQYFEAMKAVIHNELPLQATETDFGLIEIATQAEVNAGTDDARAVTPKKLKEGGLWPVGVGQTWTDMTSSRALGVTYTNNTGRSIQVSVCAEEVASNNEVNFYINGYLVSTQSGAGSVTTFSNWEFIIPAGSTYRAHSPGVSTLRHWFELR